jgi:sugar/nucleoside kinase (ribokinase family)
MRQPRYAVAGIGNAIVDVLSRVDDAFLGAHGIAKGTMRLVGEDEAERLYAAMPAAVEISGGSGANTIAGLASFGASAAFIGKVKHDQLGEVFGHDIRAAGVHFATPPAMKGAATARCLVMVTPDGERSMNTFLGASQGLAPEDIEERVIADAGITYLEGYLWDPPQAKEAFKRAARLARKHGRRVALTLSDPFCVDRHRESFLDLIRDGIDILFANEAEIKALYRAAGFDEALQAARRDCKLAALTRSGAGSVLVTDSEVHVVEAVKLARVVDSTGAGDLYAAGFLFGLTAGRDLVACARLGSLAAAEVISHIGARPEKPLCELAREAGLLAG